MFRIDPDALIIIMAAIGFAVLLFVAPMKDHYDEERNWNSIGCQQSGVKL